MAYTNAQFAQLFEQFPTPRAISLGPLQSKIYYHLQECEIAMQTTQEIILAVEGMKKPVMMKNSKGRTVPASCEYKRLYHSTSVNVRRALGAMENHGLVVGAYNSWDKRAALWWLALREDEIPAPGKSA